MPTLRLGVLATRPLRRPGSIYRFLREAPHPVHSSDSAHTSGPSPRPAAATLEFRDATKLYPGQTEPAVDSLSLTVPAGDICVLVGPSGCGKTTAMRMANRMIDMTGGDILLDGQSIKERKPAELRREIGYAIQQIGLFPHLSVADNIATVPRLLGWSKERIRARVEELLELVSLEPGETRDRYPGQLSGGQRQRVGVARALAVDPPLMLMDEPFGAIDPINRERLQNEFLRLQREIRKTIVFVTHDIDEAIKMGDRIAIMQRGGKLAQYAPPAELLMQPANSFVEDFVGADRALKRLSLQRVRDIDLWQGDEVPYELVTDEQERPVSWRSPDGRQSPATPVLELDDVLRDALSDLLAEEAQYGPVVDEHGKVVGVLSIEILAHALHEEVEA